MDDHGVSNIISSRQRKNSWASTVMTGILTGHLNCLSPWEQTIAARIFLQVATNSKRIDRSPLFRNISCIYQRQMSQQPDQAILLVLQVKHNQTKQNVQKLSRGKSNINNSSGHLNKHLQTNRVLRMDCTVRNHMCHLKIPLPMNLQKVYSVVLIRPKSALSYSLARRVKGSTV